MTDMEKAYQLAAAAVRQRLAEQHAEDLQILGEISKREVSVFSGNFDGVQEVLRRLEVPFTLDPNPARLPPGIVFANCSSSASPQLVQQIEPYVRAGGWLVSSDWSLQNVVQAAFPNTVRHKTGKGTGNEVVGVEPALESFWSAVVVLGADPQWWMETGSYPIEILDSERVRLEAASHELLVRYGAPAVAVRFDWEQGHVYHAISHFWLKQSRVPHERYRRPCTEFLRAGMRLSDEGIARALTQAKVQPEELTFAAIQSAATSTELIAQLCIRCHRARAARQG